MVDGGSGPAPDVRRGEVLVPRRHRWRGRAVARRHGSLAGADEVSSAQVLEAYEHECALADAVIQRTPLSATAALWREEWGPLQVESLVDVIVHVLKETSTHAGHLDVAREFIDGHQHLVMS